ncbi:hypothetical protein PAXRUDRAFT_658529 [Paxillus rubicundulus Ve08.2h10]|uniref:Uncharacterized protein n=1 Tax=Paxillus rubicundulus Ve08.2h10 TaxID=930991 RepID=A0A0D0E2A2_9AGAM|nr:hypothetical protein PAXRUDRAFT_658529 [Paxillus rubicundulus Ve08.2h10]
MPLSFSSLFSSSPCSVSSPSSFSTPGRAVGLSSLPNFGFAHPIRCLSCFASSRSSTHSWTLGDQPWLMGDSECKVVVEFFCYSSPSNACPHHPDSSS